MIHFSNLFVHPIFIKHTAPVFHRIILFTNTLLTGRELDILNRGGGGTDQFDISHIFQSRHCITHSDQHHDGTGTTPCVHLVSRSTRQKNIEIQQHRRLQSHALKHVHVSMIPCSVRNIYEDTNITTGDGIPTLRL